MRVILAISVVAGLATTARAGELEWSIGGGIDDTASRSGDASKDFVFATGGLLATHLGVFIAGGAANVEISEGLGLRLGAVLGAGTMVTSRSRISLLAESGVHRVSAQEDAKATLPYVGLRLGIDRWRSAQGGRSHGLWLTWQQDVTTATATHSYEVCSLFGPCRTEHDDYDLGGWAAMLVYRLASVSP